MAIASQSAVGFSIPIKSISSARQQPPGIKKNIYIYNENIYQIISY